MRMRCIALLSALINLLAGQTISISGTYLDQKGNPISEAKVKYTQAIIVVDSTITASDGAFSLTIPVLDVDDDAKVAREFGLSQNYPNPFNPTTRFTASLKDPGSVTIYNILGQQVDWLRLTGFGEYTISWGGAAASGSLVSAGLYFYVLRSGESVTAMKMTLLDKGDGDRLGIVGRNVEKGAAGAARTLPSWDDLSFVKDNTSTLLLNFNTPEADTSLGTITGNVGPTVLSNPPDTTINVGDTLVYNLLDYVYNDSKTWFHDPPIPGELVVLFDSLFGFVSVDTGSWNYMLYATDSADVALFDSLSFTIEVHENIVPTMDLPDTMTVYEGMAGTALIEDLRDYRTDNDTDEVAFEITEHPNSDLIILSISGYSMNIDHVLEDVQAYDAVIVSISDGVSTTLDTMILEVLDVNNSPIVIAQPPDFVISEGDSLIMQVLDYITDADNWLTYQLLNLSNATQTNVGIGPNAQIIVKPTQGFTGDIIDVVLQGSDYEYDVQTDPFNITVNPRPLSQLTIIQRDFYTQEPITTDTSWFNIRQLSPYEWSIDSVYFSLDGVLNVELPYGDYEINTTAANTADGAQWWTAESYLGLTRDTDLKPFSKIGGDGGRCEFTLDQPTDQINANKVMLDFALDDVVMYMGGAVIAFGDSAQDATFVWDLNYDQPDAGELAWTNDYIAMIQGGQFNTLTMPVIQTTEIPVEPHTRDAVGIEFPPPGSNGTTYNDVTYEIIECHARFAPGFSLYTYFIENIQAQYRIMDFSGEDPPVFQDDGNGGIELNEMGNQLVDFSDFWGAGYFSAAPALALFIEQEINEGNTDITMQMMGSNQYSTSMSTTIRDFSGLTDYLKEYPIETNDK